MDGRGVLPQRRIHLPGKTPESSTRGRKYSRNENKLNSGGKKRRAGVDNYGRSESKLNPGGKRRRAGVDNYGRNECKLYSGGKKR